MNPKPMRDSLPERDEEIDDALGREAVRRLKEILDDKVETIPAVDAIAQLRARIAKAETQRKDESQTTRSEPRS